MTNETFAWTAEGDPMPCYAFDIQCREPRLDPDAKFVRYVWCVAEPEFENWYSENLQHAVDSAVRMHQFADHDPVSIRLLSPGMSTPVYPRKGRYSR